MEVSDLIEQIDIVEYISQFCELEKRGEEYWCLSPFTDEKTPSFSVRQETQSFFDFSSGLGGNVFTYTKYYYHCSSYQAVEILKKYLGYDGEVNVRRRMVATSVCKKFSPPKSKKQQSTAKALPDNYMDQYEKDWDKLKLWEDEGISKEALEKFQVYYDAFSNRIVYPVRNLEGKIVNVGGRTLVPDYKEKGLRKYTYFMKWGGEMNIIYGLYDNMSAILAKREVIIFEGCKSVLHAYSWGIKNTAAILTSHLSPAQMKILAKLGVRVVFALDKEVDIRKDHNINRLKRYVNVEYLWDRDNLLDEKMAPVDNGEEVFKKLYEQRIKLR